MPRILLPLLITVTFCASAAAQCLTDFKKLVPDEGVIYDKFGFGYSVSVFDDVLAIGSFDSDTLGYTNGGIVYVYAKAVDGSWKPAGILKPSLPSANLQFGSSVQVSANYIVVGAGFNSGLYVFRKPASGWTTSTETALMKPGGSVAFGTTWSFDESKNLLAAHDPSLQSGVLYIYHKPVAQEWSNSIVPQVIEHPKKANGEILFGIGGVKIYGDRIASGIEAGIGFSKDDVFIFRDQSGTFNNYQLEAELTSPSPPPYRTYGPMFEFNQTGIIRYGDGKFTVYNTPASGTWANNTPFCQWTVPKIDGLDQSTTSFHASTNFAAVGEKIFVSSMLSDQSSRLIVYTRNGGSWCSNASMQVIYSEPSQAQGGSLFERSLSVYDGTEIAFSWTSAVHDASNLYRSVGVMDLVTQKKQFLVKAEYSAGDSRFGSSLWASGDILFTSSINEYVSGKKLGAVYIWQKSNGQWQKVNKLSSPGSSSDHSFGGFITGNGEFVAISGLGYEPEKIYIYKKDGADLTHPVLWQTLDIPGSDTEDYDYTKPVMTDEWLVVPIANYSDGSEYLVFYQKDQNGQWSFTQKLKIGTMMVFFKLPHHVAMYEGTLAVTNGYDKVFLLEIDPQNNLWAPKYTLTASDPDHDPFLVLPPFPTIYADASFFGYSISMNENEIFVGAPGKNDTFLDVGAVYVYTKPANGSWASGTETKKILPVTKAQNLYFGSELELKNNILAVGATSSTAPGSVYILQALDYQWNNITQLLRLTGDTFAFDGYGVTLALNETDFFIGAPRETNAMGTSAGAAYVTPSPPMVKLEPPVCITSNPYDLVGYPFDGVWSGNGITNANKGTFDPSVAGTGTHELTYITPNCAYPGKLRITVSDGPLVEPATPTNITLCDKGVTAATLGVRPESDVTYQWSYRKTDNDPWANLSNSKTEEITVTNTTTGEYKIAADNGLCSIVNEFTVMKEEMELTLQPLTSICDTTEKINLEASPTGGTWEVTGVSKTLVDPGDPPTLRVRELNDGAYDIRYSYKSVNQCLYDKTTPLVIDRVGEPSIVSSGEFCSGNVVLTLQNLKQATNTTWMKDGQSLNIGGQHLSVLNGGEYYAVAEKNGCTFQTNMISIIEDKTSFLIPNVITANGDTFNEDFQVKADNLRNFSIIMVNRDGTEVFRSNDVNFKWNAPDVSTGVYYYVARYVDCSNETQTNTGWLSVMK